MKKVIFISVAYFYAQVFCQDYQNVEPLVTEKNRPSMLSSLTESYGGVWLNATQKPTNGLCEIEEIYVEEVSITDKIPYDVEVEVWCWSIRCTEWETRYRDEIRRENVTKTRKVAQCCENYEMNPETNECEPICMRSCENFGACVAPDTCKCDYGYQGKYCEIDTIPEGLLSGPNVCEREEMREEIVRVMEQEIVERVEKEWCWPKIRCTKTKLESVPVEKLQKMIKPHVMRYCCEGHAQNFKGNRCFPVQYNEEYQLQVM